tara:strand:- start:683 stop:1972 length:1290 start_codon:yes stop_codon:yes gene_type:complete
MGNTGRKPSIETAKKDNTPVGFMTRSSGNGPGGQRLYQAWRWNGEDWTKVSENAYNRWLADTTRAEYLDGSEINATIIEVGPLAGKLPSNAPDCYRWPSDTLDTGTDYIFFQFGKYLPPFSRDAQSLRASSEAVLGEDFKYGSEKLRDELGEGSTASATQSMYNASASQLDVTNQPTIMLPMPQDLSTESNQQWQGKQFTATGRAATAALAAGNFSYASSVVENIAGNATALQNAFNTSILNSIPGVGGNLDFNDVSGSTRGVVINPNAELLYDAPEMREVGMIFRLVPRNYDESLEINYIIKAFRKASMPSWGSEDQTLLNGERTTQGGNIEKPTGFNLGDMNNWIHVPKLCKFTFMTGSKANKHLIQYKPCAISGVEVNYTPDGTWSSHTNPNNDNVMPGSAPTAIELRLNFMETKLIYADEVDRGF